MHHYYNEHDNANFFVKLIKEITWLCRTRMIHPLAEEELRHNTNRKDKMQKAGKTIVKQKISPDS